MAINFYDLSMPELEDYLVSMGHKKFRAHQLHTWVYRKKTCDFSKMLNLSKDFRKELESLLYFELPKMTSKQVSKDGTKKFLFDVGNGLTIESVLIPSKDRLTLCVSSEVGCNMACDFCYTGKTKLKKRLSVSDIVGQVIGAQAQLTEEQSISNIVFMGMGEPLDNSDAVFSAIEIFKSPLGLQLSRKRITVSTSGILPEIHKVAKAGVRLAVSLNAVNNEVRDKIMPINKRWPIESLLKTCKEFIEDSGDKVTFEYVLLKGVTDSLADAAALHRLTKDIPCKINIIPFNEHPETDFLRPSEQQVIKFQDKLIKLGTHVLRRKTMGRDILAACGQLAKHGEKISKKKLTSNQPTEVSV